MLERRGRRLDARERRPHSVGISNTSSEASIVDEAGPLPPEGSVRQGCLPSVRFDAGCTTESSNRLAALSASSPPSQHSPAPRPYAVSVRTIAPTEACATTASLRNGRPRRIKSATPRRWPASPPTPSQDLR